MKPATKYIDLAKPAECRVFQLDSHGRTVSADSRRFAWQESQICKMVQVRA